MEQQFLETVATQPELLAQHYTEAGLTALALPYWQRAGQYALQRSAYVEAISHLTRGLELLSSLPETVEHIRQELDVQMALASALTATKGLAAPEAGHALDRARQLCQQLGETRQLLLVLGGLVPFYINRGEYQTAREVGEQMLSLAQSVPDPAAIANAHIMLGNALSVLGELGSARTHLEQGIAFYTAQQHRSQGFIIATTHQRVFGLSRLAQTLWLLGYPDQAVQRSQEALTAARTLASPAGVVTALFFAAEVSMRCRDEHKTYEQAEAALVLAREHGLAFRVAQATILRGWGLVEQGQGEVGIAQICQGLAALHATGAEGPLSLLVEAYGRVGQIEDGLRVVAEALAMSAGMGESRGTVELHRLKGELLLTRSAEHQAEAETCFHQALAVARHQQAKSLELRAAMSWARLWLQQGKQAESYELLAPIYGWFTEGLDTADLQEARVLLKSLT